LYFLQVYYEKLGNQKHNNLQK